MKLFKITLSSVKGKIMISLDTNVISYYFHIDMNLLTSDLITLFYWNSHPRISEDFHTEFRKAFDSVIH